MGPNDREHRSGGGQRHAIPDGAGTESNDGTHSTAGTDGTANARPHARSTRATAMPTFAIVDAATLALLSYDTPRPNHCWSCLMAQLRSFIIALYSRVAALIIAPGSAVPPVRRQAWRGACTPSVHSAVPPRQRVRATHSAQDVRLVSGATSATPTNGCDAYKYSVRGSCCRSYYQMQRIQWLLMAPVPVTVAAMPKSCGLTLRRAHLSLVCLKRAVVQCRTCAAQAGVPPPAALAAVEASSAHGSSGLLQSFFLLRMQFQI